MLFDYFCLIHHVLLLHYFVECGVDFEIVVNVVKCLVAQTEILNEEVTDVGWGCNFQT